MNIKGIFKPEFWDADPKSAGPYKQLFDYKRIWQLCIGILVAVSLVPILIMASIDFSVTRGAIISENTLEAARTTSIPAVRFVLLRSGISITAAG